MISSFFNITATVLHTSTGINSDGCEVQSTVSSEVIPGFMYTLSSSKSYLNNVSGHYITKQFWCNSPIQSLKESFDVQIMSGCTTSGNIEITLGATPTVTIAVTSTGNITAAYVATAIASATYVDWTVTSNGDTVNFTAIKGGAQTLSVIDTNSTGVTQQAAHFVEVGTDGVNVIALTDKLVFEGLEYWIESVNTVLDVGMGQYVDLSLVK